jgi:hypothetical protein
MSRVGEDDRLTIPSPMVANPIANVPKKSDCTLWFIMSVHTLGQTA